MNAHFLKSEYLELGLPEDFIALVSSVSDIAFITDRTGVILDLIWNLDGSDSFQPITLIGDRLQNTVTPESRIKIDEMLKAEDQGTGSRYREVNHQISDLPECPVRYSAIGAGDSVIFIGQEIRAIAALQSRLVQAQRALDEDYSRLRQLETQYRVLFQTSSEALLVLDATTGRVEDANTATAQLVGAEVSALKGSVLLSLFADESAGAVGEGLTNVNASGQTEKFRARLRETRTEVDCSLSIFRAANATVILCTLSPATPASVGNGAIEDLLLGMVGRIPDAMVLTDESGRIRWSNEAFLGMAEIALQQQAEREPLARFLGRPGVDLDIIIANAREHGRLRAFSSTLTGAFGSETQVEISVAVLSDPEATIGFVMRDISRYDQAPARRSERSFDSDTDLMELVGTVPLKDLVRASTEEIEKMCIESALKKTGNNRASAAELLGLSRQSLYVKLRRFGLLERDT